MATPLNPTDENATFLAKGREPYSVVYLPYVLGQTKTVEARSIWQFSEAERAEVHETGLIFLRCYNYQPIVCLFNADPVEFEGHQSFVHEDCVTLPGDRRLVSFDGRMTMAITSAWQLNPAGMKDFRENGGYVILCVVGGMADVELLGNKPEGI